MYAQDRFVVQSVLEILCILLLKDSESFRKINSNYFITKVLLKQIRVTENSVFIDTTLRNSLKNLLPVAVCICQVDRVLFS